MYEEVVDGDVTVIKYTTDEGQVWWIPVNERNADYQQYLNWKLTQAVSPDQTA